MRPMIAESLPIVQDFPGAQKPVRYADHVRQQELPDDHKIIRELKKTHITEQGKGGLAQATEVYLTKDGQKVIFRTKIDKASSHTIM